MDLVAVMVRAAILLILIALHANLSLFTIYYYYLLFITVQCTAVFTVHLCEFNSLGAQIGVKL